MWNGHPIFKYGFVDHLDKDDDNEGILESKTDGHEDGDGILNIYDKDDDNDGIPDFLSLLLSFNLPPNLRDFLSFYIIFHFRFGMIKNKRSDRTERTFKETTKSPKISKNKRKI